MSKIDNPNLNLNISSKKDKSKDEIDGYNGLDPARYGDWQHKGKVTDF